VSSSEGPGSTESLPIVREDEKSDEATVRISEAFVVNRAGEPVATVQEVVASYFAGPLPSPEALADYNRALPGLGERIVSNWEEETRHRRGIERRVVESGIRNQSRGQLIAASIAIIVALGGIGLIAGGHSTAGLVALLPNVVALVGLFIYNGVKSRSS
jgi:uncharacterized membrane protein